MRSDPNKQVKQERCQAPSIQTEHCAALRPLDTFLLSPNAEPLGSLLRVYSAGSSRLLQKFWNGTVEFVFSTVQSVFVSVNWVRARPK
jgi:hypothetical protein